MKQKNFLANNVKPVQIISLTPIALSVAAHGDNRHFENKQDVRVKVIKVAGNNYMLQYEFLAKPKSAFCPYIIVNVLTGQ